VTFFGDVALESPLDVASFEGSTLSDEVPMKLQFGVVDVLSEDAIESAGFAGEGYGET
jgi:hypothetical protein